MSGEPADDVTVSYNENLDILTVDREAEPYERSVVHGDAIIDLTPEGRVRGVEIQNVSRLLDATPESLHKVSEASISSSVEGDKRSVTVTLTDHRRSSTFAAQISDPASIAGLDGSNG